MSSGDFSLVRDLLARRAYKDAHALCMKAIQSNPRQGEPYFLLGILAADHENHAKAIELYDRAIGLGAEPSEGLAQKARSLIALNYRDQALAAAQQAAEHGRAEVAAVAAQRGGHAVARGGLSTCCKNFFQRQ